MQITLATSRAEDTAALESMFQEFLREAGYHLGATRHPGGQFTHGSLAPDLKANAAGGATHFSIYADGNLAGFAITTNLKDPAEEPELRALFIVPELRRQLVGRRALAELFGLRRGLWRVDVPLAFAPAAQFFAATLHLFAKNGVRTEGVVDTDSGRIAHRELEVAIPANGPRSSWIQSTPQNPGFPVNRRHHIIRRRVLVASILVPLFGQLLAIAIANASELDAAAFISVACSVIGGVLMLVYLEMVVTGILDRQDRGPILPPIWEDEA